MKAFQSCWNILRERGPRVGKPCSEAETAQDSQIHRQTRGSKNSPVGGRLWAGTAPRPGWFFPETGPRVSVPVGRWGSPKEGSVPASRDTIHSQWGQDEDGTDGVAAGGKAFPEAQIHLLPDLAAPTS